MLTHQDRSSHLGGAQYYENQHAKSYKQQNVKYYNYGRRGDSTQDCIFKKEPVEGNLITSGNHQDTDDSDFEWDFILPLPL